MMSLSIKFFLLHGYDFAEYFFNLFISVKKLPVLLLVNCSSNLHHLWTIRICDTVLGCLSLAFVDGQDLIWA